MTERTYHIKPVSLQYRIINTVLILAGGLYLFCAHYKLDILEIIACALIALIMLMVMGFIYKKTIPTEKITLNSEGFHYEKIKKFPFKSKQTFFFQWKNTIGYQRLDFRLTTEFQLNFEDQTCFKFNHSNSWNKDDFEKMYLELYAYQHLFLPSENPNPKGITIFETRWIQTAMIFISVFAIYVGYNLYLTEEKGALFVTTIFGLGSLYYWYRVLDNWSKKK